MANLKQIVVILSVTFSMALGTRAAFATCPPDPSGYACRCDNDTTPTQWVCATWDQGAAPDLNVDFFVDYSCDGCEDAPEVKFATAETWEMYSEALDAQGDPDGPADLGDVLLADDVSPNDGDFSVSITNPSGFEAANVSSIVLNSTDASWTGGSSVGAEGTTSFITGDVGDILVVEDSGGNEGAALGTTYIDGDVTGTLTIPNIEGYIRIYGDLADGDVGTIAAGGQLRVDVNLDGGGSPHELEVDSLAGTLKILGQIPHSGILTVLDLQGSGTLEVSGLYSGSLDLVNGIDSVDASVTVSFLQGELDLYDNDVDGVLAIGASNSNGSVTNGGTVNGLVNFGTFSGVYAETKGSVTFASVASGGEIAAPYGDVMEGVIHVEGDMDGLIDVDVDVQEDVSGTGVIQVDGDLGGTVECAADLASSGEITIGGAMTGTSQVVVDGDCDGLISVDENTTTNALIHCKSSLGSSGLIRVNASEGEFSAGGKIVVGSISGAPVYGDYDGCVMVLDESGSGDAGDLDGRLRIAVCDDEASSDPDFDHSVRIEGDVNGTIDIANGTCTNQPSYSPNGACESY